MKERYILTSTIYHAKRDITFYGLALIDENDGMYELIQEFNDLVEDKKDVLQLVNDCNERKVDILHFKSVIEDFLTSR